MNKTKEQILKEFDELTIYLNSSYGVDDYRKLLIKAISQTREETIREVLEVVRDLDIFGYPAITKEEFKEMLDDIPNKLKK